MKLRYRDDIHAYWLDGRRCKGVSSVAKIPDDTYSLTQWVKRTVALGIASRPDLIEAIAAHHDDRDKLDEIVEVAIEAAKANDASRRGTAKHRITERHDAGESILMTDLAEQVIAAWSGLLEAHRLEVVPELIERITVDPDALISGRYDRILGDQSGLYVADLKTGANQMKYAHAIAVQLALYAHAPLLAGPLDGRGETETFEPMPQVDKTVGLVLHLPDEGEPSLVEVDIAAGWECWQEVIAPTLRWRKRDGLIRPRGASAPRPPLDRSELDDRFSRLADEQKGVLRDRWPLPGVKLADLATPAQVQAVLAVIDEITGFDPPEVERQPAERHQPAQPVAVPDPPAEGPPIDVATYEAFQARYATLGVEAKQWIGAIAADAATAGGPISLTQLRSVRRFELGRALVALAAAEQDDDALVRLLAASAAGSPELDAVSIPAGAALAALSAGEAANFARLVDATLSGEPMRLDERGLVAA